MLEQKINPPASFEVINGGRPLQQEVTLDSKEALENLKHVLLEFYKVYNETRLEYGFGPDPDFVVREMDQNGIIEKSRRGLILIANNYGLCEAGLGPSIAPRSAG